MPLATDTAFQIMASNCRFGSGITHEVGMDLVDLGAKTRTAGDRSSRATSGDRLGRAAVAGGQQTRLRRVRRDRD